MGEEEKKEQRTRGRKSEDEGCSVYYYRWCKAGIPSGPRLVVVKAADQREAKRVV